MDAVVRSASHEQSEILDGIRRLHCPNGFEVDLTYGNGSFYDGTSIPRPVHCFDIQPLSEHVKMADSSSIPLESGSVGSVVFDPPFLTYIRNGRDHKGGEMAMSARFGGYWSYQDLESHYSATIRESARILRKGGTLTVKCQDIIHNHKMHCTHAMVIKMAEESGMRLLDLFVLVAKHRMPSPQKGQQRHARIWHSYFLVFTKTSATEPPTNFTNSQ